MKEETIRCFISIAVDKRIQESIKDIQQQLIRHLVSPGTKISWAKTETIHLTLKFLGDIPADRAIECAKF